MAQRHSYLLPIEYRFSEPPVGHFRDKSSIECRRLCRVRINDNAPVMRAVGDNVIELTPTNFGFPPPRPKVSPIFNFRSDGRDFSDSKHCPRARVSLLRVHRYEVSEGQASVHANDAPFMAIAGLWREGQGNQPSTFTMLATEPGPTAKSLCCVPRTGQPGPISRSPKPSCCDHCRKARSRL